MRRHRELHAQIYLHRIQISIWCHAVLAESRPQSVRMYCARALSIECVKREFEGDQVVWVQIIDGRLTRHGVGYLSLQGEYS